MTRRLTVEWPDPRPFRARDGRPIRLLAVSDETDRTLEDPRNREALGTLDGIVACGDLEPSWLGFLGDAFCVPIVRVVGNHDDERGPAARQLPGPLDAAVERRFPVPVAGLSWPGRPPIRRELTAWRQALNVALAALGRGPVLVASHVAPRDAGDGPDVYHRGSSAYRWLLRRLRPPLWLHGHTTLAYAVDWRVRAGGTVVANVTGSVLVELTAPG